MDVTYISLFIYQNHLGVCHTDTRESRLHTDSVYVNVGYR